MQNDRSSRARAEAAAWLARLHADDRDTIDEKGFRDWLAASAEHTAAFEAADRMWSAVGGVPREEYEKRPRFSSRRAVMAGGLGLLTVAAGGILFRRPATAQVYETGIGEQKHVTLDDGSQLFLDAQTRVSVLYNERTRRANMHYGRVNFFTVKDLQRPFLIDTALRTVVSNHCRFDVRCDGDEMQLVVIEGQAIVMPVAGADSFPAETLRDGERLVASSTSQRRDRPDLSALLSWQNGIATFDNTALAKAAREMNRYSTVRLEIEPGLAQLKVSGVYHVGDNSAFARSVSALLPVAVRQKDGVIFLASKNNG
jgi:transmembrane sensor